MTPTWFRGAPLATIAVVLISLPATGQIRRDPNGVNVNAQAATTVFITYGNLQGMLPVEAEWCGELIPAMPAVGLRCDPATLFGRLPIRYDQSRSSGLDGFTDVMSIPPSVARRAYQAAVAGATSSFFYVRRFTDPSGVRPDEYVFVTCRMTGGGARTPFALVDVRIAFETDDPVLSVMTGASPPRLAARIAYNGTGRLRGRWEIVFPGEEPPSPDDLRTEATLPAELRGTQRRFTELERFNVFLPPTGEFTLPGPEPEKLPTRLPGLHLVLLRVEAVDDKEGDSNLGIAGAGAGVVHSGGVAGFPIPPLRYYVGSGTGIGSASGGLELWLPAEGAGLAAGAPVLFSWSAVAGAALYRLEVENESGIRVLEALVEPDERSYRAPPWLAERLATAAFRWRVAALDAGGRRLASTGWRPARISP
jgi:hypothetical protein